MLAHRGSGNGQLEDLIIGYSDRPDSSEIVDRRGADGDRLGPVEQRVVLRGNDERCRGLAGRNHDLCRHGSLGLVAAVEPDGQRAGAVRVAAPDGTRGGPAVSLIVAGLIVTVRVSTSVTCTVTLADAYPAAVAEMTAVCVPSSNKSSTPTTANVVESLFAGIVTVAGTEASETSLLARLTTSGWLLSPPLRVSVAVAMPPSSRIVAGVDRQAQCGIAGVDFPHGQRIGTDGVVAPRRISGPGQRIVLYIVRVRDSQIVGPVVRERVLQVSVDAQYGLVQSRPIVVEGQLLALVVKQAQVGPQATGVVERRVDVEADQLACSHREAVHVDVDIGDDGVGDVCGVADTADSTVASLSVSSESTGRACTMSW